MNSSGWTLRTSQSGIRRYVLSLLIQLLFVFGQAEAMPLTPDPDTFAANGGGHSQTATLASTERETEAGTPADGGSPDFLAAAAPASVQPGARACPPALPAPSSICFSPLRSYLVRAPPLFPLA